MRFIAAAVVRNGAISSASFNVLSTRSQLHPKKPISAAVASGMGKRQRSRYARITSARSSTGTVLVADKGLFDRANET